MAVVGYSDLVRAWSNWEPYICNYFEYSVTNAYTVSLNNLIRVMNRLGRGYSFEALQAKILFAEGTHKIGKQRPKLQLQQSTRITDLSRVANFDAGEEYLEVAPFLRRDCSDSDLGESQISTWH